MKGALVAMALCACVPEDGPLMRPGEDCMACHGGDGSIVPGGVTDAKAWTTAGTVFDRANTSRGAEGAQVQITDANGFSFSLRTNLVGNFYTRETIRLPLQTCISRNGRTLCMQSPATSGACNLCHGLGSAPQPPLTAP
jgi:hypothetical protein